MHKYIFLAACLLATHGNAMQPTATTTIDTQTLVAVLHRLDTLEKQVQELQHKQGIKPETVTQRSFEQQYKVLDAAARTQEAIKNSRLPVDTQKVDTQKVVAPAIPVRPRQTMPYDSDSSDEI